MAFCIRFVCVSHYSFLCILCDCRPYCNVYREMAFSPPRRYSSQFTFGISCDFLLHRYSYGLSLLRQQARGRSGVWLCKKMLCSIFLLSSGRAVIGRAERREVEVFRSHFECLGNEGEKACETRRSLPSFCLSTPFKGGQSSTRL